MSVIKVLLLEDDEDDAYLLLQTLRAGGLDVESFQVESEAEFKTALNRGGWDLVISDYSLPGFTGLDALRIYKQHRVHIPFILVSGAVGEEIAVTVMREGAHDYILKHDMIRLVPAIRRELDEAALRREKEASEAKLRSKEISYQRLFDSSNDNILILNRDRIIQDVNETACKVTGFSREDLVGKPVQPLFLASAQQDVDDALALLRKKDVVRFDSTLLSIDGDHILVDVAGSVVDPEIERIQLVMRDITERIQMETQIKKDLKEKQILLQEIHHRVKNNLQIMSSLMNLQVSMVDDPRVIDVLNNSRGRIKSMALIHELMYRAESFAEISMNHYISHLVDYLKQMLITGENIQFNMQVDEISLNLNQSIPCSLIINELLTNAIKHAFPENRKGRITLLLSRKQNNCHIMIADNGVGLKEGQSETMGKSLGLRIVRDLVEQLEGKLVLKTRHGFHVNINFRIVESE